MKPSLSIVLRASSDCGVSRWSMTFSDVPASEPIRAWSANAASVPTVSSRDRPVWWASRPPWRSDMPSPDMSAADLFAAADRTSAMWETSLPCRPNVFIACAEMTAASARSICPDAASAREPFRAPPVMSATETPARASSASAFAASVAVKLVVLPAASAAARSCCICRADAPVTARTLDSALSNLAADAAAMAKPVTMAVPTAAPAPARREVWSAAVRIDRVYWLMSARSRTVTVRVATGHPPSRSMWTCMPWEEPFLSW